MIKILTILGARPQFIKASAISRCFRELFSCRVEERILHTGQHYDDSMSDVFFREMGIPSPAYNLAVGSGSHASMTAAMLVGIERILDEWKPDAVIVFGDTNTTLAGALVASKMGVCLIHIEAGLRSFNKSMPEEINRILTDNVSTLLFTPTETGLLNLFREGFDNENELPYHIDNPGIFHCGDVMFDNALFFADAAKAHFGLPEKIMGKSQPYVLATVHRSTNTDDPEKLRGIWEGFDQISREHKISFIIPLHPRTKKLVEQDADLTKKIESNPWLFVTPPASFLEMFALEKKSFLIMTDSGGVQKEAYFLKKPCIVLRAETEWVELLHTGACELGDSFPETMKEAFESLSGKAGLEFPSIFGDGRASKFICEKIVAHILND